MMDFSMPICDGPTASTRIRELLTKEGIARKNQTFIACLSAYSESSYKKIALEAGMDCFLTKPIFQKSVHKLLIQANLIK